MKADQYLQIEFIKDFLRKGETRGEIMVKFRKAWKNTGRATFDNRLKIAGEAIQREFDHISAEVSKGIEKQIKERTSKIMSVIERQELLSEIMKGELKTVEPFIMKDKIIEYKKSANHNDRIKAISELNKMDGSHAAQKLEHTFIEQPLWNLLESQPQSESSPGLLKGKE